MSVESALAGVMDNPYTEWSPLAFRPKLEWPGGAKLALGVMLTLEHMAWYPAPDTRIASLVSRGRPGAYPNTPDIHNISQWEYGNRVGVYRVMDVLERFGITPIVAMDVTVAERSPFLVEYLASRGAEFVGHGISSEQMVTEAMPEDEERALIADTVRRLSDVTGSTIRGWHGAEYSESSRTVALLAEAGLDYVLDWPNDEQPTPMKVPTGQMTNLPVTVELDDLFSYYDHTITAPELAVVMNDCFDRLYADGADSGRLLLLNVHPWLTGQPFRIKYFASAIAHMCAQPALWKATGAQIVDWHRKASVLG